MITGQIKNQIDQIWDTFWESAGITNPMTVLEQMTYLFFIKMLDDAQIQRESIDNVMGMDHLSDDTFAYGSWHNPDTDEDVPMNDLRWHTFKHFDSEKMYRHIQRNVFPYIQTLNRGENSAYSRFMGNANFMIASPRALVKIVDGIDTLEMNDRDTLILANPPFAGNLDYEAVSKSLLAIAKTKKTELLFLSLFMRSLAVGGRCASIVPDGVLTGTSNAHKAIRKAIVDGNRLEAVISMPSGVFQPYSGVSTAILIFTNTGAGGTDKVWFYDMKADGYSLDQKRTEVADNDIPDIIARFHSHVGTHPGASASPEESRTRTDKSFLVPVEEIREHDYDLAFNTYKETIREVIEYEAPEVLISRAATLASKISNEINSLQSLIIN